METLLHIAYLAMIFGLVCRVIYLDGKIVDIKHQLGLRDQDTMDDVTATISELRCRAKREHA